MYKEGGTALCRKQLQEQCKLVIEENQLLMEQLDLQQSKEKEWQRLHMQEGNFIVYQEMRGGNLILYSII